MTREDLGGPIVKRSESILGIRKLSFLEFEIQTAEHAKDTKLSAELQEAHSYPAFIIMNSFYREGAPGACEFGHGSLYLVRLEKLEPCPVLERID